MKFIDKLHKSSQKNNSLLCIGLDIDLSRIPQTLLNQSDPIYLFNREIISATKDLVCAYKPNMAFYEMHGMYGLSSLVKTIEFINSLNIPIILDAKRGDIGNSSAAYAKAIFQVFKADATTLSPYMGQDSVEPFLEHKDKGIFILCMTSNSGAKDFQFPDLYKSVAKKAKEWDHNKNCGLVVGATKPEELKEIREIVPDMPLLIPGIGTQGGDIEKTVKNGVNKKGENAIINSSRSIIYASQNQDFAEAARSAAKDLRDKINEYRWVK